MESKVIGVIVSVIAAILMLIVLLIAIGKIGGEVKKSANIVERTLGGL